MDFVRVLGIDFSNYVELLEYIKFLKNDFVRLNLVLDRRIMMFLERIVDGFFVEFNILVLSLDFDGDDGF